MAYAQGPIAERTYGLYRGDNLLRYTNGAEAVVWYIDQAQVDWDSIEDVADVVRAIRGGYCANNGSTAQAVVVIEKNPTLPR